MSYTKGSSNQVTVALNGLQTGEEEPATYLTQGEEKPCAKGWGKGGASGKNR